MKSTIKRYNKLGWMCILIQYILLIKEYTLVVNNSTWQQVLPWAIASFIFCVIAIYLFLTSIKLHNRYDQ